MASKQGPLCRVFITVAKNGFEVEASYEAPKSLSQKKGWVPCSYSEPEKYVMNTKADLLKKIGELVQDKKEK